MQISLYFESANNFFAKEKYILIKQYNEITLKTDIYNAKINYKNNKLKLDGRELIRNLIKIQILIYELSAGSCLYYKRIRFANIIDE